MALKQDSETRLAAFREKEAARVAAAEAEMAAESQRRVQELAVAAQERIARASQVDGICTDWPLECRLHWHKAMNKDR